MIGKIVVENGSQVAVVEGDSGVVTKLSAICTHKRCTVGWNNEAQTWDCPCHGSRYSPEGRVIRGPAVKDLQKMAS